MKYPGLTQMGSTNAVAVKEIKNRLNLFLGTTLDITNGNFGQTTKDMVIKFQQQNSLKDDGVVGDLTWERLQNPKPVPSGNPDNILDLIIRILLGQLYVRELTGHNDGKEVEEYLKSVGLGKGYSYCMAFIYWGFMTACANLQKRNPLIRTGGVLAQWNSLGTKYRIFKDPKPGDIFIMDFGKGAGHTGMVTKVFGDRIHTIEGNTSADPAIVSADREGNGVFERSRKISSINKGFLRFTEKDFSNA